ncbi:MAG: 4Fe-4S dicluster domain-containing protein [Armatimonadota bacterium]|nr:4Fe-4S dicluster domain-containing protein [Armatimonadota bacterium]
MKWEQDALDAISKAPVLLRPMIKRKVESRVSARGGSIVTLDDVNEARGAASPKAARKAAIDQQPNTEDVGITPDEIEKVIASTPQSAVVSESRYYEVKVCGGAFGCPRALFDVSAFADKIIAHIEKSGVSEAVASRVKGPILRHHKFSVAIAGCPNSCSQPQIHDFGAQGRARVEINDNPCVECMGCVKVCNEGSMKVEDATPEIDRSKCINCGDCATVCPTESLFIEKRGYTILAGGKLGRHPQLARELAEFTDEPTLLASLDVIADVFKNEMQPGERMADAVTRIGADTLTARFAR